jgi:hypothetical protein
MIASLIPSFAIQNADKAWADDEWLLGMEFTGTCRIGPYVMVGGQSYFTMTDFDGKLGELGVGTQTFECINHTAANPPEQTAPYTATITEIDEAGGRIKFKVAVVPEGATDGSSNENGLIGYQRVGGDIWVEVEFKGKIDLVKVSSNESLTAGNALYSLEGAKYGIYNDAACTTLLQTMTTDATGYATSEKLTAGTYYVKEMAASTGFTLDTAVYTVVVKSGQTTRVNGTNVNESPQMAYIDLQKKSAVTQITEGNSQYSLTGAQYKIYSDQALKTEVGTLITNASGYAKSSALPLGTYYVKETKAPAGYELDSAVYTVVLKTGDTTVRVNDQFVYDLPVSYPTVEVVSKKDSESGGNAAGGTSFAGAQFTVKYYAEQYSSVAAAQNSGKLVRTWVLKCDTDGVAKLDDSYLVSGDALFKNTQGKAVLPLGTITVQETKAPSGYYINDSIALRNITASASDQTVAEFKPITGSDAISEVVYRGDLKLIKARESDQQRLAGIPFKIVSQTTGEWHIAVTDENGYLDTSSNWNAHTSNTNVNDAALKADGTVDESMLNVSAGIWFGPTSALTNQKGALIYDIYTIEELRVAANAGLELVSIRNVYIKSNGALVDLGTIDNQSGSETTPWIKTTARGADTGDKTAISDTSTTLIDRVEYHNLSVTETNGGAIIYTLKTTLYDKTTGLPVTNADGSSVATETIFTPSEANGYIEASVTFDATSLAGRDVVFFEELYRQGTTTPVADHKDIDDYEQTIRLQTVGNLNTVARNAADGTNIAIADTATTLVDRVYYSGLVANGTTEYRLRSTLVDTKTSQTVRDNAGNPITADVYFTPTTSAGYVDVEFEFDARDFAGRHVVFFEELYRGDSTTPIASHKDIDDYRQTIMLTAPLVQTYAIDASSGGKTMSATTDQIITDTITYTNLVAGKTYDVTTTLKEHYFVSNEDNFNNNVADTDDGEGEGGREEPSSSNDSSNSADNDSTDDVNKDENRVETDGGYWIARDIEDASQTFTIEWQFTPAATNGTASVDIPIDTSAMHGKSLVVYQEISTDGQIVASHKDIASHDQSVYVQAPSIVSDLSAANGGEKTVRAAARSKLSDTVAYSDLVWGSAYTLYGMLIDPDTLLPHLTNGTNDMDSSMLASFIYDIVKTFGDTTHLASNDTFAEYLGSEASAKDGNANLEQSSDASDAADTDTSNTFPKTLEGLEAVFAKYPGLKDSMILGTHSFTPDASEGTATLTYTFDSSHLAGKTLTSVMLLVKDASGAVESTEHDLTNPYQSAKVITEAIGTQAFGKANLEKLIAIGEEVIVTDEVTYTNLEVGQGYVLEGVLYDKETGQPLIINGEKVTASTSFTAIAENGTAYLDFAIDTSDLTGKHLVVFERLYRLVNNNGWFGRELVASHEDIASVDQTVTVDLERPSETENTPEESSPEVIPTEEGSSGETTTVPSILAPTSDKIAQAALIIAVICAAAAWAVKRRKA